MWVGTKYPWASPLQSAEKTALYALLVTMAIVLGCALLVHTMEAGGGGPIDSVGDAIWWSITTVTTVGYGDMFPVTPAGRGVAAVLMLTWIAVFGVLTANLAALLVDHGTDEADEDGASLSARLDRIEAQLAALTHVLLEDQEPVGSRPSTIPHR